jgi:Cu(I)/Ag(I) efflux system membrane protein CusA/SilA
VRQGTLIMNKTPIDKRACSRLTSVLAGATVQLGSEFRRSVLEKDGREVTGGVVMMRYGENPLEVTRNIKAKIRELQKGLPAGVRIVPFYDRTRLIHGAISSVTTVLEHEMIIAAVAILVILVHLRSVVVVVLSLPLSVLIAFLLMHALGISSNIMSLSGIAISIGILVDQSIVMLENATHRLTAHFGDQRITGDTTEIVVGACRQVGRPIFFSVVIMVISFLPVFALTGQEGKLFHPLAFTKTFALIGTAVISVTLVPAIIPLLIRGRLSREENNWIIRSVVEMYRPVLNFLMRRPKTVIWLFVLLLAVGFYFARHLGREFMPPLDEGSIMDMPVTAPRASVTGVADDLKARNALIRIMPEVELIVGKAGRADTPTDPAPLDMVETVITLRPKEQWLKRKLKVEDARGETDRVVRLLESQGALKPFTSDTDRKAFVNSVAGSALDRYDALIRPEIMGRLMAFDEQLADDSVLAVINNLVARIDANKGWVTPLDPAERTTLVDGLKQEYRDRFLVEPQVYDVDSLVAQALAQLVQSKHIDAARGDLLAPVETVAAKLVAPLAGVALPDFQTEAEEMIGALKDLEREGWTRATNQELFDIAMTLFERALLDEIRAAANMQSLWRENETAARLLPQTLAETFGKTAFLWVKTKQDLVSELDKLVHELGWSNIWTQPIINRVDMLATGVRTQLAVKVFGTSLDQIQQVSNQIAEVLRGIPGAVDVVADQTIGKGYIEIEVDRERAARYGVNVGDIQDVIEVALGGKPITTTVEGRERYPVRLRYARDYREDEETIKSILISRGGMEGVPAKGTQAAMAEQAAVYLRDVADVRVVEGPVMIKSESGLLRSYVQLNVRDRDIIGFVEEAQRAVDAKVTLPEGSYLQWTGQFEHQVRAKKTLRIVFPAVLLLIFVILYLTYHDFTHAVLMMLAVPGALAGGVLFQALFGYNFSVAVWVGYIACFGMATETGIIMLVYLRDAIAERGGLTKIASIEDLEKAVLAGAVHRLRPKFLTEATAIVGLAPMLWAHGVGAEVMAPMAAPVLGGLLIADEVIDIFLPVLFYQVEARRWRKLKHVGS